MPIYREVPEPFECVICNGQFPRKWTDPAQRDIPPVCWSCEQQCSIGPYGDRNPDRRIARQISALAECLISAAWQHKYKEKGWF